MNAISQNIFQFNQTSNVRTFADEKGEVISSQVISVHNGLYSLTDLHKASGGENKHLLSDDLLCWRIQS